MKTNKQLANKVVGLVLVLSALTGLSAGLARAQSDVPDNMLSTSVTTLTDTELADAAELPDCNYKVDATTACTIRLYPNSITQLDTNIPKADAKTQGVRATPVGCDFDRIELRDSHGQPIGDLTSGGLLSDMKGTYQVVANFGRSVCLMKFEPVTQTLQTGADLTGTQSDVPDNLLSL
jgi:hypothetical protein